MSLAAPPPLKTEVEVAGPAGGRRFRFVAPGRTRTVAEDPARPYADTGNALFDGLFALAIEEVRENSVDAVRAHAFNDGLPIPLEAFETGEMWQYVWTRDLAYAVDLGLASLDVRRCVTSLMYKTSGWKPSVSDAPPDAGEQQILQDTGSGGSYPVSTDRVIWALAAERVLHHLDADEQDDWVRRTLPILAATIEFDRKLIFDAKLGLYRGEQSFLDWREQTYPNRTATDLLPITMSPAMSTNVAHYVLLNLAAQWHARLGNAAAAETYAGYAADLKTAINARFYDPDAKLYAGYLLVDLAAAVRVHRYDLLGNCLAVLTGIADTQQDHDILNHYPTGPFGPPVVWPQESTVPIYHNYAIWPFVTAYWAKAARQAGHERAVAAAVASMAHAAARHLSNMENLDFGSGDTHAHAHGLSGPAINSRRQLWSVAGYVGLVQEVLLGMETTADGVRFRPCLPPETRDAYFAGRTAIGLRRIAYRGKTIDLTVTWPDDSAGRTLAVSRVTLNGRTISGDFVPADALSDTNDWHVELLPTPPSRAEHLRTVTDFVNPRNVFGPPEPQWLPIGGGGLSVSGGRVRLHYEPVGDRDVRYNIYRDGQLVATHVEATTWTDPQSADHARHAREYAVEAVYPDTGNHSFPTVARVQPLIAASEQALPLLPPPQRCGPGPVAFTVDAPEPGRFLLRLRFANGNGAVNTGLTCGIKRVTVTTGESTLAAGYVFCPQTGGWDAYRWSSPVEVCVDAAGPVRVTIDEDAACRNMSYFAHNTAYTGHQGGGPEACNEIDVAAVGLLCVET